MSSLFVCACAAPSPPVDSAAAADVLSEASLDASAVDASAVDVSAVDVSAVDASAPNDDALLDVARDSADATDVTTRDAVASDAAPLPALDDFSLGPYPSALALIQRSIASNVRALDSSATFTESAAQGYLLQAIARFLQAARGREFPGGEAARDALVTTAIAEVDELVAGSTRVVGGAPGYGLDAAWDAFGDGSTNPAFTNYAWQTGMVATGVGELLLYLRDAGARHADRSVAARRMQSFLSSMITPYQTRSSTIAGASPPAAYYWYSFAPADAKNTHNTNALIATATWMLGELEASAALRARAQQSSEALRVHIRTVSSRYEWNYVDDGYPVAQRRAEDISHALLTTQFMRFSRDRGWLSNGHMTALANTFTDAIWSGHPAKMNGRVDGTSAGASDWTYTRAAILGFAANADAPGGDPLLFDLARSALVSARLARFDLPLSSGTVDPVGLDALATLLLHRPSPFAPDSRWSVVAGPGDDAAPVDERGGARFYRADWAAPAPSTAATLSLVARASTAINANFLVDLPEAQTGPVSVSITWRSSSDGSVQQFDGASYRTRAPLPATTDENGVERWMRTTFVFDSATAADYERSIPGRNVLFQCTNNLRIHRIEATPLR
jgi:hypothetical protein